MSGGPVTVSTSSLALGLAQVRLGASAANIALLPPQLVAGNSIGSLANTKFIGDIEIWKHESGFPLLEDYDIPLRVSAGLECAFEEITPKNLAFALGIDATTGYAEAHSGEIPIGAVAAPAYLRMEARYTFPNASNYMDIIFPRAQVAGSLEMDLQKEDAAAVPITLEAKRADSNVSGGNALWDDRPLGSIQFT